MSPSVLESPALWHSIDLKSASMSRQNTQKGTVAKFRASLQGERTKRSFGILHDCFRSKNVGEVFTATL